MTMWHCKGGGGGGGCKIFAKSAQRSLASPLHENDLETCITEGKHSRLFFVWGGGGGGGGGFASPSSKQKLINRSRVLTRQVHLQNKRSGKC